MAIFATQTRPSSHAISVGGEGIAAAQFSRCGFDVLVQAGHDKPTYDLAVTRAGNLLKVCVRASDNGRWSLVHPYLKNPLESRGSRAECQKAVDQWLDSQASRLVVCLVQFEGVSFYEMPRIYIASPFEIARRMLDTVDRLEDSALYEAYDWVSPFDAVHRSESLPRNWRFSPERIEQLLSSQSDEIMSRHMRSRAFSTSAPADKPEKSRIVALSA